MYTSKKKRIAYWELFCDLLSLNLAFMVLLVLRYHSFCQVPQHPEYKSLFVIANVLYLLIYFAHFKDVSLNRQKLLDKALPEARSILILFVILYFGVMVFIQGYQYSRAFHLIFLGSFAALFTLQRILILPRIRNMIMKSGRKVKVVLVGAGRIGRLYVSKLQQMSEYYDLVGVLDDNPNAHRYFNGQFKGSTDRLEDILRTHKVDEVVVSIPPDNNKKIERIAETASRYYAMVKMIPRYPADFSWRRVQIEDFEGMWLFTTSQSRLLLLRYQVSKRMFDILFSSVVLLTVFPIMSLLIGPGIKIGSKGSVFFSQRRRGYRGEEFNCLKFRTMKVMDKSAEILQAHANDPRKTKLGDYLRKASLDEFPQFWNVLRGEMSVVGPRPHMVEHDDIYNELISNYHVRLFGKPGITGWAQINGYRGATDDPELMRKRVEHDIWYLENWSFWLDLKIIFLTVVRLFSGDPNAY